MKQLHKVTTVRRIEAEKRRQEHVTEEERELDRKIDLDLLAIAEMKKRKLNTIGQWKCSILTTKIGRWN